MQSAARAGPIQRTSDVTEPAWIPADHGVRAALRSSGGSRQRIAELIRSSARLAPELTLRQADLRTRSAHERQTPASGPGAGRALPSP